MAKKKAHAKKESIKKAKAASESKAKAESESKASSIAASSSSAASVVAQSRAAQSSSAARTQQTSTSSTTAQADRSNPDTWNQPYKGYSSYNAYLKANNGDPEVQQQTADMQEQWLEQQGYANSDGSPTQKSEDEGMASNGSW